MNEAVPNKSEITNGGVTTGVTEAVKRPLAPPKRSFSIEFFVGLFMLGSLACVGYLAIGLGGLDLGSDGSYIIKAEFDNISGLKAGAPVEIAGVPVGQVVGIVLDDAIAVVSLKIDSDVKIKTDDTALVRTQGIIGDRYVKISRGASEEYLTEGGIIFDTESVVDLEDVIGKFLHNIEGDKETEEDKDTSEETATQ